MSEKDNKDGIEFFKKVFEMQGVAISTVKDGHIMMFKREWLEKFLESDPDQKEFLVLLKQPEFKN